MTNVTRESAFSEGRPFWGNAVLREQSTCHKVSVGGHVSNFRFTHAASFPSCRAVTRAMFTDRVQFLHCHHQCRHHQQCHCTSFEPHIDQLQFSMALACTCCENPLTTSTAKIPA